VNTERNCEDGPCAILDHYGTLDGFASVRVYMSWQFRDNLKKRIWYA